MEASAVMVVIFRWMHVIAAALAIGGVFFMRLVLPAGLAGMEPEVRQQVFLRCRRVFKMVIHSCILLLLVSGIYNSMRLFGQYRANPPLLHGLWGGHMLLALVVFGISLWLLAGKEPPPTHRTWALLNLVLLLAVVAVASTLKTAREASQGAAAAQVAR